MSSTWYRLLCFGLLVVLFLSPKSAFSLKITEFMANNDSTIADEDGDFSDWLEIHNESGVGVDVGGHYLTDDDGDLTKWQLPSVVIPAGGYLLVWASDKDRAVAGSELHTNYKLSSGGEYTALIAPDGTTVVHEYAPAYPPQQEDVSYGLAADLTSERCFLDPTPGAANDETQACSFIEDVLFDVSHGFFDAPFNVSLSNITPGTTIHYTLDASSPSEFHGTEYTGPIPITTTTALRAVAFIPGVAEGDIGTQTYIFPADVLLQSEATIPPGYPSAWGSFVPADWDMDPDVVNDPLYASTLVDDLKSIPTISVVTDIDNLWDPDTGVYMNPGGHGIEWERPISVEMIFPDGTPGFQKDAGIRMQGQTSRNPANRKHSLSLRFRGIYDGDLIYPVFPDSPVDDFTQLRLHARHQTSWHSVYGGDPNKALFIRDTYARDTLGDMGQVTSHVRYVHLYLNGIYWGLYGLKEKPDDDFHASHFGGSDDDYDVFKDNSLESGDEVAYDTLQDLSKQDMSVLANYNAVLEYLDADSVIDYILMNIFIGNRDWGYHNWIVARKREPGAGFKYYAWDSEISLVSAKGNTGGAGGPLGVYRRLRDGSDEFRLRIGDRIQKHFFHDGALTPKSATERFLRRVNEVDRAVVAESARWGDKTRSNQPYTRDDEWLVERQRLLLEYFPQRSDAVFDAARSRGVYPDIDAPTFNQHGGDFFPGFELEITAPDGVIYYTDDGSDPRVPGGAVSPTALTYSAPIPLSDSLTVRTRALSGSEWSALVEADFLAATPVRITELMYHAPLGSDYDFAEIQNIGSTTVDLAGLAFTDGISFTFPSYMLAPGDHVLIVKDIPSFNAQYGAGKPIVGSYSGNLSNGGEQVRLEDASGGAIHDFEYDDAWYPTTDGDGFSLVIRDSGADRSVWETAEGWRPSTFTNGSPAAAELPFCSDFVDNDGDSLVDLADPGCGGDPNNNIEDPECNDGIDNDSDGLTDVADPQCDDESGSVEAAQPVDPFLCYRDRRNSAGERFESVDVTLTDDVDGTVIFTVQREAAICAPGDVNRTGVVTDTTTFLESYKMREDSGQPKHVRRREVHVEDQFGPIFVDTKSRADRLLVPTAVSTVGPTTAPDPASHKVDHYKCYQVRISSGPPKYFPRSAQVHYAGTWDDVDLDLRRPKHLCSPVDKNGEGVENPDGYLMCYPAKIDKFSPDHERVTGLHTANQFGNEVLDTIREEEVCVPARVISGF